MAIVIIRSSDKRPGQYQCNTELCNMKINNLGYMELGGSVVVYWFFNAP